MSFIAVKTQRRLFVALRLIYPGGFTRIPTQKEAAVLAGMASNTVFLLNHEQNRVAITIKANFFYLLDMAGLFTLVPQLLS